jgi:DNA-binding GntR family transcriptional regulator
LDSELFITCEPGNVNSTTQLLQEKGYDFRTIVPVHRVIPSTRLVSQMLNVPVGTEVYYCERVREVEGVVCEFERLYLPYSLVMGIERTDLEKTSLTKALQELGLTRSRLEESISIVRTTSDEAQVLGISQRSDVMLITGCGYVLEYPDQPIEYFQKTSRPGFYHFAGMRNNG